MGVSGSPQYHNRPIIFPGGVGVSGDSVDEDEKVAFGGAAGYEPLDNIAKLGYP